VNTKPRSLLLAAVVLSMTIAALSSCGKSGSSGYPTGPGGGGGGGGGGGLELNSGDFGASGTYQHTFATAGTFGYHCIHHGPMTGSVVVSASATDAVVNVSITSSTSPFPAATVKPGGMVIWTNNTAMVHTVTSN